MMLCMAMLMAGIHCFWMFSGSTTSTLTVSTVMEEPSTTGACSLSLHAAMRHNTIRLCIHTLQFMAINTF